MEPLGAKENVDQTQILGLAVGEPLMNVRQQIRRPLSRATSRAGHLQRLASHNDHDLTEVARGGANRVLRIVSINSDRKGIGRKPVFYVGVDIDGNATVR